MAWLQSGKIIGCNSIYYTKFQGINPLVGPLVDNVKLQLYGIMWCKVFEGFMVLWRFWGGGLWNVIQYTIL